MTDAAELPAFARLEDEIGWYDRKSRYSQQTFKILKLWTISDMRPLVPLLTNIRSFHVSQR